jgi:TDG/mug DNA glycosylase family protein
MGVIFGFDFRLPYEERVSALLDHHVAVWDVIQRCARKGSADQAIQHEEPNELIGLLSEHGRISHIAFNGGRAADTARKRVPELLDLPGLTWHQMPSTSPAHASRSLQEKVQAWSQIRDWLQVESA